MDQSVRQKPTTFAEQRAFTRSHVQAGFDAIDSNHDGKLNLKEWSDDNWDSISLYSSDPGRVSEIEYLQSVFGPINDPISGPSIRSYRSDPFKQRFRLFDSGHKGYWTRTDADKYSEVEFNKLDRNHDSSLSRSEAIGGK